SKEEPEKAASEWVRDLQRVQVVFKKPWRPGSLRQYLPCCKAEITLVSHLYVAACLWVGASVVQGWGKRGSPEDPKGSELASSKYIPGGLIIRYRLSVDRCAENAHRIRVYRKEKLRRQGPGPIEPERNRIDI